MKTTKKIFIGGFSFLLLCLIAYCVMMITLKNEYKKFTPIKTKQLDSDLYSINDDFVNIFILHKNNQYLVIDSGNTKKNVEKGFNELGININNVSVMLLTHTDYDHVAQVDLHKNAEIYLSEAEEQMITGEINRSPFMHNKLQSKYTILPNNGIQTIKGWKVQTILIPGHTVGSVCYFIDDKYLFTGDSIALISNKVMPFNDFFNMDTEQQKKNISNIAYLKNVSLVLTAHYGISEKYTELFSDWINREEKSN